VTIVDSGPLVALLNRRDPLHDWTVTQMRDLQGPLFTCEPVITEVLFLIRSSERAVERVFDLIEERALVVDFPLRPQFQRVRSLMHKYRSMPMSLADASIVCMAEFHGAEPVFTLDSDFRVYRKNGNEPLTLIMPA
jgi:predicted nucleic acid-binding protein